MPLRTDTATRRMRATPSVLYRAFATAEAMQAWLPPEGMRGQMLAFDFREGGGYRLRLVYEDASDAPGKSSPDADEVEVRFTKLVADQSIVQAAVFESEDPAFAGEMRITWHFEPAQGGQHTQVTVRCDNVPAGIGEADHQAGLRSSLANLAAFVESAGS